MFNCNLCNKICKNKSGLTKHILKCEETSQKNCDYCKKEFKSIYSLKRHIEDNRCEIKSKQESTRILIEKNELETKLQEEKDTYIYLQNKIK